MIGRILDRDEIAAAAEALMPCGGDPQTDAADLRALEAQAGHTCLMLANHGLAALRIDWTWRWGKAVVVEVAQRMWGESSAEARIVEDYAATMEEVTR